MHKSNLSFNVIWITVILFSALSMRSMEQDNKCEQLAVQAEEYDRNDCFLSELPIEMLSKLQSLKDNVKFFMRLSITCKKFNRLLTFKEIGRRCKYYTLEDKKSVLYDMSRRIDAFDRLPMFILVCAGVNIDHQVHISLIESAVANDDVQLVKLLFEHHANPNTKELKRDPVFFYAKTVEMAQVFVDNHADLHLKGSLGTNVLWNILDNRYSLDLMKFYLAEKVDTTTLPNINKGKHSGCCYAFREESLLHRFAETEYSGNFGDIANFLEKAKLLLTTLPNQVNAFDQYGRTPLDIVEESLKTAIRNKASAAQIAFESLIGLFYEHNGSTATTLRVFASIAIEKLNLPLSVDCWR